MGILLGQLPPAEVARLKAELAETLIANFCYPRFFDYRTGSLRMRPVDRTKRQEVWLFLSSVDFTSWSRVDLMSPDFQRQIERLFIHFVQRNRNFFGEQGRKRMVDVRTLISSCATSVTEGLRGHLKGQQNNSAFGSPRPVFSWATTNITGHPEPSWEQLASRTMLIQQQLQEVRGEIKASAANGTTITSPNETRPATTRRSTRARSNGDSTSSGERVAPVSPTPNIVVNKPASLGDGRSPSRGPSVPVSEPKTTSPLNPPTDSVKAPAATPAPARKAEPADIPVSPAPSVPPTPQASVKTPDKPAGASAPSPHVPEQVLPFISPEPKASRESSVEEMAIEVLPSISPEPKASRESGVEEMAIEVLQPPAIPPSVQSRSLSQPKQTSPAAVTVGKSESTTVLVTDEDVVIFEQMRHQLVVWLRIEAVRSGADISGQGPIQLLELLHQQDSIDDSRLEVVSTLLNLSDQVITNKQATLVEYKQAMMFYLMHTRRS